METAQFRRPSGGYGRIWATTYEGSLVGSGPEVFCLWPYIISKMRSVPDIGATVLLNPVLLAPIFGVDAAFVERGITKLQEPDPDSKNGLEQEGRRIVHLVGFLYQVVNGDDYRKIRSAEAHAEAQARYRAKKKKPARSQRAVREENEARERRFAAAEQNGDQAGADAIAAEGL